MTWFAPYRKAVVAALIAGLAVILTALSTGQPLTVALGVAAAAAALGTLQLTWAVPNRDDSAETTAIKVAVAASLADLADRIRAGKHSRGE